MLLEMKNISKYFGPVAAVKNVSLQAAAGEILGLLGENGAGKSTLMNVLAGVYPADSGEIFFDGKKLEHMTNKKAREAGIRFIHQELNLVNDLTVRENLFLGEELTGRFGIVDRKEMERRSIQVLRDMGLDIDVNMDVRDLETSRKQLIEIAKALLFDAKLIIMDEPTTALTNREIDMLFSIMRRLREKNIAMIYISHKMPELFAICDRYTVLRDGMFIESGRFCDIDEGRATELLVGKNILNEVLTKDPVPEDVLMEVKQITAAGKFEDVSFHINRGEIVAVTGLHGDGRDFLAEALYGVCKIDSGEVWINGRRLSYKSVKDTLRNGVSMVQRNRKERSIIKDLTILNNFSISKFIADGSRRFVDDAREESAFLARKEGLSIKVESHNDYITALSGGNQQKVIIARCLELDSSVIILDNPTQGVDVGAKFEVYKIITQLAREGKAILIFTQEFPEIFKVADRCLIMYRGRIVKELPRNEFNEIDMMGYAVGAKTEVRHATV
ncbi:MAG: sugar ABC transporter ATP-binding protein [Fusobacteriaceae bacterium]|nr:sugar ABC transporter ATP-binding protein [Fusobacteriaceae bacterium]